YLIFEVDRVWASAGHGIRFDQVGVSQCDDTCDNNTVKELYELGYLCFVVHPKALVPIYAFWWHPSFTDNTWTNVFCACEFDPELFAIYLSYTDSAYLIAVWYAAVELQQQSSLPPAKPRALWFEAAIELEVLYRRCESPSLSVQVAEPGSPSLEKAGAMPFEEKLEQLEHFCLDLRETLEDRLLLVLADLEKQVPDLLQKFQRESEDGAERAEKLRELEVRVEMFCRRMSTQEERLQSCAERAEKSVALPQLRSLCREELQKKLSEEDLLGTTALVRKQQDALNEVQLQLQRLLDRLHLAGLRQGPCCCESLDADLPFVVLMDVA
ncbi:unnamed protein product, partial [Cladocopium goreaui]